MPCVCYWKAHVLSAVYKWHSAFLFTDLICITSWIGCLFFDHHYYQVAHKKNISSASNLLGQWSRTVPPYQGSTLIFNRFCFHIWTIYNIMLMLSRVTLLRTLTDKINMFHTYLVMNDDDDKTWLCAVWLVMEENPRHFARKRKIQNGLAWGCRLKKMHTHVTQGLFSPFSV